MKVHPTPHSPGLISEVSHLTLRENARNTLRPRIEELDHQLAALHDEDVTPAGRVAMQTLRESWQDLVDALALGPAPETRTCPVCGNVVMRAASRCERCWSSLASLDSPKGG